MKRILAVISALAIMLTLVACQKGEQGDNTITAKPSDVVLKSENYSFNLAESTYIFNRYFIEFYNENAQYLSFYGIDVEKSLKDQIYQKDVTWFDYFANEAQTYMKELLVFCEGAKAAGKELDEEDISEIDEIIEEFYDEAEGGGYKSVDEFVQKYYGGAVTINDVRSFVEKEKLAFKHYNDLIESYQFTAEEEDEYFKENPDEFKYVNYAYYIFDEKNDRDALYNARELKDTADSEAFYSYIANYEENVIKLDEEEREGAQTANYVTKEDGAVSEWAFEAKIGDKFVDENGADGIYTVYMLLSEPAIQDYTVRDIRYICLTKATYQTNEKTKAKANAILAEWEESEKTAEAFGELATKYSEDEDSKAGGGLYKNVDKSNSILSEEGMKWLFEDSQPGDTILLKGEEMYYILYNQAIGKEQWRVVADNAMGEEKYISDSEAMIEKHKVEVFEDVLNQIDE